MEEEASQDWTWFAIPCILRDDHRSRDFSMGSADTSSGFIVSKVDFGEALVFRHFRCSSYSVGVRRVAQTLWVVGLEVSWSPTQSEKSIKDFIDDTCHSRLKNWQFEGQCDPCSFEILAKRILDHFALHHVQMGDFVFSGTSLSCFSESLHWRESDHSVFGVGLDVKPFFARVAGAFAAGFFLEKVKKITSCKDYNDYETMEHCLLDISSVKLELFDSSLAFKILDNVQHHLKLHLKVFRSWQKELRFKEMQQDAVRKLKETQLHKQMVGQRVKRKHCFDITFGLLAAVLAPFAIVTSAFGMNNEDIPVYVSWGWLLGGCAFISLFIFACFIVLYWHFTRKVSAIQRNEETLIDERITRASNKFSFLKRTQPKTWLGEFDEMEKRGFEKTSIVPEYTRSVSIELQRK